MDMCKINIGMTFYGGVSLAVYEAGVAEEFIRFIQFCKDNKDKCSLPDIDVKVISGTSAGGLAAVQMANILVNTSESDTISRYIEKMRAMWFDIADISKLQYERGDVRSFLNNDILEEKFKELLRMKKDDKGLCYEKEDDEFEIRVTATNMDGLFDAIPIGDDFTYNQAFPTIRHNEVFIFTGGEIRKASGNKELLEKIVKASRITSSFPGAFPPQYTQSQSFHPDTIEQISKNKDKPLHFWYFDGGVLDNKPLGHAIDYIEKSSSDGDWWYFFVDPNPDDMLPRKSENKESKFGEDSKNPPDPATTIKTVAKVLLDETIYYDLKRIQKINYQVMQVNDLISDIWRVVEKYTNNSDDYKELINLLDENIATSHLQRFLPDYLKAFTMLSYRFPKMDTDKELINTRHESIKDNMPPLDIRNIIDKCHSLISDEEKFKEIDNSKRETLIAILKNDKVNGILKEYDGVKKEVEKAQLRFRQITFWIEDDYINEKLTTLEDFNTAQENLEKVVNRLSETYDGLIDSLEISPSSKGLEKLVKKIDLFFRLNIAVHAAAGIETHDKINVVKIYHDNKHGKLAGARLGNFSAFLDRSWRKHDYLMGKKDTRDMLKGKLEKIINNAKFWEEYDGWSKNIETEIKDSNYRLNDCRKSEGGDILEDQDMQFESLPAQKIIPSVNTMLKTFERLIVKYDCKDKNFIWHWLRKLKINVLLKPLRFFIWLIQQATAQPQQKKDANKCIITLAKWKAHGYRTFGLLSIGTITGIAISFFLPDKLKELALRSEGNKIFAIFLGSIIYFVLYWLFPSTSWLWCRVRIILSVIVGFLAYHYTFYLKTLEFLSNIWHFLSDSLGSK